MMYRTRKIVSIAPASTMTTAVARNAILFFLPQLGGMLFIALMTLDRHPLFAAVLGMLFLAHLPAIILRGARSARCSIDPRSMQVDWKSAKHIDQRLLATSLGSLAFAAVACTFFFIIFH